MVNLRLKFYHFFLIFRFKIKYKFHQKNFILLDLILYI